MTINEKRGSKMQLNQESTEYLDWFRACIVPMVRRRIEEGATKYGDLLPAEHDDRDFGAEALEELVDAVFYVQRLELQRRYLARENEHLLSTLAQIRAAVRCVEADDAK
jgi:hypothetical protein